MIALWTDIILNTKRSSKNLTNLLIYIRLIYIHLQSITWQISHILLECDPNAVECSQFTVLPSMTGLPCSWNTSTRAETRNWNMLQKLAMSSWCSSEVMSDFRLWFSSDSQIIREPSCLTTFHCTNSLCSLRRNKLFKLVSLNFLFCLCIWSFDILKNFLL